MFVLWEFTTRAQCVFSHQRSKTPLTRSDSGNSDDNYVPMNPGSSPLSAALADSPKNIYIPMSPGPHHFDFPQFAATLPARKGSSASMCQRPGRLSDVTPPPINRNLKPNRKCKFLKLGCHSAKVWVVIVKSNLWCLTGRKFRVWVQFYSEIFLCWTHCECMWWCRRWIKNSRRKNTLILLRLVNPCLLISSKDSYQS